MHLISTLNPLSKSEANLPVAIFSYGDRRIFLRISEDYQNTLRGVIRGFGLDDDVHHVSLRTSTIDACQGKQVEIDEHAYPLIWSFLDNIDVSVVERTQVERGHILGENRALSSTGVEPPFSPLERAFNFPAASSTITHPQLTFNERRSSKPDSLGKGTGGSSKVIDTMGGGGDYSQKPSKYSDDDDEYGGDQLEEIYEVLQEEKVVPLKTVDVRPTTGPEDNGEGGSSSEKTFKPTGPFIPKFNKGTGSPIKKETIAVPNIEVPTATPQKQSETVKLNPPASQLEEDTRFDITIRGPKNETAQFKTRGKHPVRKVLAAACKTFGIKYERARLVLCIEFDDQIDEFDCPAEETISQCGVDGNAKLVVRVNEDRDSDAYEG